MARKNKCPAHRDELRIVETKKGPIVKGGSEYDRQRMQESVDRSHKALLEEVKKNGKTQERRNKRK